MVGTHDAIAWLRDEVGSFVNFKLGAEASSTASTTREKKVKRMDDNRGQAAHAQRVSFPSPFLERKDEYRIQLAAELAIIDKLVRGGPETS